MSNEDWLHALEARIDQPEHSAADLHATHDPVELGRRFVASKWKPGSTVPPPAPSTSANYTHLSPQSIDWDLMDPDAYERVDLHSLLDSAPLASMDSGLESTPDMLEAPEHDLHDDWFQPLPAAKAHSVMPVAMHISDDHPSHEASIDHNPAARFAYTAIIGALCIAAAAVFVWNPRTPRSFATTAVANQIPSMLGAVANLKPPISVYDLPIEQVLLDEVRISSDEGQDSPSTEGKKPSLSQAKQSKSSESLPPFEYRQASSAIDTAVALSQACKTEQMPPESVRVQLTFAPSGNVTQASVDAPAYVGSPTATCILKLLKGAKIPAYEGPSVSVSRTYQMR